MFLTLSFESLDLKTTKFEEVFLPSLYLAHLVTLALLFVNSLVPATVPSSFSHGWLAPSKALSAPIAPPL